MKHIIILIISIIFFSGCTTNEYTAEDYEYEIYELQEKIEELEDCIYSHESQKSAIYNMLEDGLYDLELGYFRDGYDLIYEARGAIDYDPC